jgi:hypothetical protein
MSNGGTPRGRPRPEQPGHELTAPQRPTERSDENHLVLGDETFHDDKQLIAELTDLNGQISRYLLRHLDAEAGRSVPTSTDDEHDLGMQLVRLGLQVLERAERRRQPLQVNRSVAGPDGANLHCGSTERST